MSEKLGDRVRPQRSLWNNAFRQFRRHKLAMAGAVIFVLFTIIAFTGPYWWPPEVNDPYEYTVGETPTLDHPMGVDDFGQDIFARILYGGRISISVGIVAAAVAISIGTLVGAAAGYFGGVVDAALMRVVDLFLSLPNLPLLLLITYLFKPSMEDWSEDLTGSRNFGIFTLIVIVVAALAWMPTARLVRAAFLSVREKEFVEAGRSIGTSTSGLIFKHIMPNVLSPIIVAATLEVGAAIITESALSFLGLGFPSDVPTWGQMLNNANNYLPIYPHVAIFPGAMIFLTVLSINYVGDGLRDALDPRKTQ